MQPVEKFSARTADDSDETVNQAWGRSLTSAGQHEDFDSLMNSMGHNSRPAENKLQSRPPASSPTVDAAQTSARLAKPANSERPTTAATSQSAAQESASPASASSSADNSAAGSAANPTVPALALLMPMTFQGASFFTSDGGQADNGTTDSKTASSSSENSASDIATTSSACWALSDPAGWLAAKLSASSAALGPALGATNAVADPTDGVAIAATSMDPAPAKGSSTAEIPSPLPAATLQVDASATTSLAASLMPAAADAQPTKAEAAAAPKDPSAHENAASAKKTASTPTNSSNSITSSKEPAHLTTPTPGSPSSTTSQVPSNSGALSDPGPLALKETIAQPNAGTSLPPPTDESQDLDNDLTAATLNAGTGVAITELSMKNQLEENKVAGSSMKLLPAEGSGGATEQILPAQWVVTGARSADTGTDVNLSFSSGDHTSTEDTAPALNSLDLPSLADARMRALDRTQDMVALHSMRLVESKMDALSVIIKPAIGTELSLDLRQQADGVEAHATLLRGDHQFLSEQWSNLQEHLEQHGIKLAELHYGPAMSANDQRQSQPQHTSEEEAAQQASAFAEFAASGQAGGASARLATVHDGWESWA